MFHTIRTPAGEAPRSSTLPDPGAPGLRGAARALRHAVLHASEPPPHSGINPLAWKLAPPALRAQLLRRHHLGSVFTHRKDGFSQRHSAVQGAASQALARSDQPRPALGLWRHHGFFRAVRHGGPLGHTFHSGGLKKLSAAAPSVAAAPPAPAAPLAHGAPSASEAASLARITQQFQVRFTQSAKDPVAFAALLKQAFGDHFDASKAEALRQQSLAGEFSWMPKIKLADASQMRDLSGTQAQGEAMGCYVKSEDTVLIHRELLARDPAQAEKVLAEEMGHALDVRLNTSDAAGDEGDIFSRLVHGETISASQLAEMKADNDHGVIEINGKKDGGRVRLAEQGLVKSVTQLRQEGGARRHQLHQEHVQGDDPYVVVGLATFDFNRVQQGMFPRPGTPQRMRPRRSRTRSRNPSRRSARSSRMP